MKTLLYFFVIASFIACSNSTGNTKKTATFKHFAINKAADSVDYCTACDSLDVWLGGIQGVESSDSTGIFLFGECHANKAYDLLCVPKGDILKFESSLSDDSLSRFYHKEKEWDYKNLDCYSFVIKKIAHKKKVSQEKDCDCEDFDTYDYVFPSVVRVFKRTDHCWLLIKTKEVTSFEQLGRVKLNTVFHIN